MKRILFIAAVLVACATTSFAAPKFRDEPSSWSLQLGPSSYLVFKFPQRVFLCPFNELSGAVATRWGGKGMHWMEIPHPMSRGTNCHYWVETIEMDGKLADQAKKFLDDSRMTTTYNEVSWKPLKVEKTTFAGKVAYSAPYKTKLLNTLAKTAFEVSGRFWMFDADKTRVVVQADAFRENYDCIPTILKAVSVAKTPSFADFKIVQTTNMSYRYLSMPFPVSPANMTYTPDGSLCTWIVGNEGSETGAIKVRQTLLGGGTMDSWKDSLMTSLKARNIENPEKMVVNTKIADRDAFYIDFPTVTDDEKKREAWVRDYCFTESGYLIEIYAISYSAKKEDAAAVWSLLEKPINGMIIWVAQ